MKRNTIIGLIISLICLGYMLHEVDMAQLWALTLRMNPWYALLTLVFLGLSFYFRSLRWRVLLCPIKQCSVSPLLSANLIGFMANNLLPARLGEFVRAYACARLIQVPAAAALGSIVVERVFDGLCVCLALFLTLLFLDPKAEAGSFNPAYLRAAGYLLLVVFLGVLVVLIALLRWPQAAPRLMTSLAARIWPKGAEKLAVLLASFTQGLEALKSGGSLAKLALYSILVWACIWGMNTVFLPAVGLPLAPFLGALALVGENLAGAVPAAPGYVGTFHVAVFWALSLAGVGAQQAMAYAILFWAVTIFAMTAAGLIEMWRQGMSLGTLKHQGEEMEGE